MARHRANTPPPAFMRKAALSLAVLAGGSMIALGPVSAATAADTTTPAAQGQEQSPIINSSAAIGTVSAPVTVSDIAAAALAETDPEPVPVDEPAPAPVDPAPVDPIPVPVDPVPVDPTPVPVDPTPVPVDPTPVDPTPVPVDPTPVDPTPVPVVPEPVQPVPVQPVPVQPAPTVEGPGAGFAPADTVQVQAGSGQPRGTAVGAVSGSRAGVVQSVPAQQLANTGMSGTDQTVAGLGLGLVVAGTAAVVLGRRDRSHGRRAARA